MRFFVFAFAVIAAASAASISSEYLTPLVDNSLFAQEFILPEISEVPAPLTDDGYRYKVVRKLKLRHRRDVNELANSEYLPPVAESKEQAAVYAAPAAQDSIVVEAPAASEEKTVLADDGYRYKTVRRIRYRYRRDVNELPTSDYLPPVAESQQEAVVEQAPVEQAPAAAEEKTVLADDGYRYKTVRRIRYRYRRDVNELPTSDYLPPVAESTQDVVVEQAPAASEENTVLADDGYRYKTVRRIRYRHRRDVNELPTNDYLPPVAESTQDVVVEQAPAASEENTVLADDGYRYKTVRRIRYRHRRDVNELPTNDYLPPVAESAQDVVVEQAPAASEEKTVLADDGYRYKTVRRIRYRYRRDVNELPTSDYLPPVAESKQDVVVEAAPAAVVDIPAASEQQTVLANDGYRYKTVRRLRYRHRRDVNELPTNDYLPPVAESKQEVVVEAAPAVQEVPAASEEKTILADDGYRYKTVRRIRYRYRRDVNELPTNDYLPPVAESTQDVVVEQAPAASEENTVLADDGYRYKTVRRIRYRHRRDVNELANIEYLPPVAAQTEEIASVVSVPEEPTVLATDGYRYKTVRKLKYRRH